MALAPEQLRKPVLHFVAAAEFELEAELDAMVLQIALRPFDDQTWAFAEEVTSRQARRGHLRSVD